MTDADVYLWIELKGQRLGVKFRRQAPIGPYSVDFVCHEKKLVVELDGSQHIAGPHDQRRDRWLRRHGFRVLRIWNSIVYEDVEEAVAMIRKYL